MSYLSPNVLDSGLAYLQANGTRLDICSSEPATYANIATYTLGNKACTVGAPGARTPNGRKVTMTAISGGSVTGTGTAGYWAISNGSNELLAANSLSASQAVTQNNTFSLGAIDIGIPNPA